MSLNPKKLPTGFAIKPMGSFFSCGANGIRTRDPHTASVVRYQLRHSPLNSYELSSPYT